MVTDTSEICLAVRQTGVDLDKYTVQTLMRSGALQILVRAIRPTEERRSKGLWSKLQQPQHSSASAIAPCAG